MAKKPPMIGAVWTARALIQYIDDAAEPARWRSVGACIDTPNAIMAHPGKTLWVKSDTGGRDIAYTPPTKLLGK